VTVPVKTGEPGKTGNRRPETGAGRTDETRKPEIEERLGHVPFVPPVEPELARGLTRPDNREAASKLGPYDRQLESSRETGKEGETLSSNSHRLSERQLPVSDLSGFRSPVSGFATSPVSGFAKPPVPSLPFPSYTHPTTRYVSKRKVPDNLIAADAHTLRPQPPHWPLVWMLTFMPAAVGLSCLAVMRPVPAMGGAVDPIALAAWVAGAAGLGASVFHLGQPLRAWRIFLGWRRSWLSREAMVFGVWFGLASAAPFQSALLIPTAVAGLAGLACSAMIYIDTHRHFWRAAQTAPRFFGVAALFALAPFAPRIAAGVLAWKLAWEWRTIFDQSTSARLQRGPLSRAGLARDSLAVVSIILLTIAPGSAALLTLFAGELAERYLFFRAVDAPKMPGVAA
jgi:DMSO reductase anchor subunit